MKRIDHLAPGQRVTLRFHRGTGSLSSEPFYDDQAVFLGIKGEGDDRRAVFTSESGDDLDQWEAYRYQGHWAYGTSAERLQLVELGEWKALPGKWINGEFTNDPALVLADQ